MFACVLLGRATRISGGPFFASFERAYGAAVLRHQAELTSHTQNSLEGCAVVVKKPFCGIPFWLVGDFATHFRTYLVGIESDVHWWYDLGFDPWPGQSRTIAFKVVE